MLCDFTQTCIMTAIAPVDNVHTIHIVIVLGAFNVSPFVFVAATVTSAIRAIML